MLPITLGKVAVFFDSMAIMRPAEKFQYNLLTKFGGYVRKTQRNSLKVGMNGKVSKPGNPPYRHSGMPDIKETVFYFVDWKSKDVVIGMVLLSDKPGGGRAMPGVLEHGGTAIIRQARERDDHKAHRAGKFIKQIRVEPRPSATPAFEKIIKKQLPGLIAGGIMREV